MGPPDQDSTGGRWVRDPGLRDSKATAPNTSSPNPSSMLLSSEALVEWVMYSTYLLPSVPQAVGRLGAVILLRPFPIDPPSWGTGCVPSWLSSHPDAPTGLGCCHADRKGLG